MKNTIILLAALFIAAVVFGQSVAIVSEQTTTLTVQGFSGGWCVQRINQ